jgi:hypothetical protein
MKPRDRGRLVPRKLAGTGTAESMMRDDLLRVGRAGRIHHAIADREADSRTDTHDLAGVLETRCRAPGFGRLRIQAETLQRSARLSAVARTATRRSLRSAPLRDFT